jgi:hypothetical protein
MEPTKKMEDINHKIEELKEKQHEIEMQLAEELIEIVKCNDGFSFDFSVLVGGVVDAIAKAKSDPSVVDGWKAVGEKICRSKNKMAPAKGEDAAAAPAADAAPADAPAT